MSVSSFSKLRLRRQFDFSYHLVAFQSQKLGRYYAPSSLLLYLPLKPPDSGLLFRVTASCWMSWNCPNQGGPRALIGSPCLVLGGVCGPLWLPRSWGHYQSHCVLGLVGWSSFALCFTYAFSEIPPWDVMSALVWVWVCVSGSVLPSLFFFNLISKNYYFFIGGTRAY